MPIQFNRGGRGETTKMKSDKKKRGSLNRRKAPEKLRW
jgi:hypothetical protein